MIEIRNWNADEARSRRVELVELLRDAVASGASIGFLPPMATHEAEDYWDGVAEALCSPARVLLVALDGHRVVGAVQLALETRSNGSHRAEVSKLMVHTAARRRGVGRALMQAVEAAAREAERTLLVLDTRAGDAAELLYRSLGYAAAGVIPVYARSADGSLDATVFMYKLLE
ncbi:MAG: GNAT family N-acetyltransferase [Bryobacteraceae bacterium]